MKPEGEALKEHLNKKYGPGMASQLDNPNFGMNQSGRAVGIHFDNSRNIYPTQKAHVLIEYLKEKHGNNDKANALMEVFYHEHFEKAANINDDAVLTQLARPFFDNDDNVITGLWKDPKNFQSVETKDRNYKRTISGVPFFEIQSSDNKEKPVTFSGAQPPDLMAELLQEAAGLS